LIEDLIKEFPEQEDFIVEYFEQFKILPHKDILECRRSAFEGARLARANGIEGRSLAEIILIKE
jgi:hypothetical protein